MLKTKELMVKESEEYGVLKDLIVKSKFPYYQTVNGTKTVFPHLEFENQTYQSKKYYNEIIRIANNDIYTDFDKERMINEVSKKIWLLEKLSGGRLNATGGRDPNKNRRELNFDHIIKKCFDDCEECGVKLNYHLKFNRWFYEVNTKCERPSLDLINREYGKYTNANTRIVCLKCNHEKRIDENLHFNKMNVLKNKHNLFEVNAA